MKKIILLLLCAGCQLVSHAQSKTSAVSPIIDSLLADMKRFQESESRTDSIAQHPLGSFNEEDFQRRYEFYKTEKQKLDTVNKSAFSFDDQINAELLNYIIEDELSNYRFKSYLNPILADEGFHTGLAGMSGTVFTTKKDVEDYLKNLHDIPRFVDENLALMRKGLALGICQPRIILNNYQNTYVQHIVSTPEKSVFWNPFSKKPYAISDADWEALKSQARKTIMEDAVRGYKSIQLFFDTEYLPKTRTTVGVSHFPDGLAYYQDRANHYTTTTLSYEEIYQLGLKEVARIQAEMMDILKEVKFKGSLRDFIAFLRTDPRFYVTTGDQLLKEASWIAKKSEAQLPALFGKLPRQPFGVAAVPAYLAPTYTAGRYAGASIKSKQPGYYWVNTYDLKSRPLYALEALTLHEAVPGHHLQGALTQELDYLPEFRRNLYVNAFGEGWGLYSEYLGTEMGFYKDPYSHFGKLTYEMWRACRLVIDVALHTKNWTREQAVNYLAEHTALSMHEVNTEINRYISWPGQALAYKMGELKIKELRKKAEDQLKEKFDVREFHDLILSQGTVTLTILDKMVDQYISQKLKG